MLTLTYRETITLPVPARYRAILGDTPRTVAVYTDAQSGEWRGPFDAGQPFLCNGCGHWRTGQYWSNPPVYLCSEDVTVTP